MIRTLTIRRADAHLGDERLGYEIEIPLMAFPAEPPTRFPSKRRITISGNEYFRPIEPLKSLGSSDSHRTIIR
jgi:hypothetical protein